MKKPPAIQRIAAAFPDCPTSSVLWSRLEPAPGEDPSDQRRWMRLQPNAASSSVGRQIIAEYVAPPLSDLWRCGYLESKGGDPFWFGTQVGASVRPVEGRTWADLPEMFRLLPIAMAMLTKPATRTAQTTLKDFADLLPISNDLLRDKP